MARRNFLTDSANHRFVQAVKPETIKRINRLAARQSLVKVARKLNIDPETAVRYNKARPTMRTIQRQRFEHTKNNIVKPIVEQLSLGALPVTVMEVIARAHSEYKVELTRDAVSKMLRALAAEGMEIKRPPEFKRAIKITQAKKSRQEPVFDKIISMRKRYPKMRDEELARRLSIPYWFLRKAITSLKKEGRLPNQRRGYKLN